MHGLFLLLKVVSSHTLNKNTFCNVLIVQLAELGDAKGPKKISFLFCLPLNLVSCGNLFDLLAEYKGMICHLLIIYYIEVDFFLLD